MTSQRSSTPAASDVLSPLLLARARAAAPPPLVSAALHQLRRSLHEARAWRAVVVEPGLVRVCPRSPRRRARGEGEPVSLWSLRPLRASCGCLEFAHLRLGICAHVGAALRALAARPRQLERALARAKTPRKLECTTVQNDLYARATLMPKSFLPILDSTTCSIWSRDRWVMSRKTESSPVRLSSASMARATTSRGASSFRES